MFLLHRDLYSTNGQDKDTSTSAIGTFAFKRMSFGLCDAPAAVKHWMISIFSTMIKQCIEVFMHDFLCLVLHVMIL